MAETRYPVPLDWSPRIATLRSARTTFARIVREYAAGKIANDDARVWSYLMQTFLQILKMEDDREARDKLIELEQRIVEIEEEKNHESRKG